MPEDWRRQLRHMPDSALIDVDAYAVEMDAIDASIRKSLEAYGKKAEMSPFGWGDPVVKNSMLVGIVRRPVSPIVASDPARVAVALLFRLHLARCVFQYGDTFGELGALQVLLAMADRLMRRKVLLSPETGADLVRVLNAPALGEYHIQLFEYLVQVLKQLEQSFSPPVAKNLRVALKQLHSNLSRPIPKQPWERRKKSSVPRRRQNACQRIERLMGES